MFRPAFVRRHEDFRAVVPVKFQQFVRIKMLGLPDMNHVFETIRRRMAVFREVRFVLALALLIHATGIPVAVLGLALRPPMPQMPNFASRYHRS